MQCSVTLFLDGADDRSCPFSADLKGHLDRPLLRDDQRQVMQANYVLTVKWCRIGGIFGLPLTAEHLIRKRLAGVRREPSPGCC